MKPDITAVTFQMLPTPTLLGEKVRMIITGAGPFFTATPVRIRIGTEGARLGALNLIDGTIDAFLLNEPADGAAVEAGWVGFPLEATSFVYHRPPIV